MHYGPYDFAVDKRLPTLMSTNQYFDIPINKELSSLDILKINLLYNCTWHLDEYRTMCLDLEPACQEIPVEQCSSSPYIAH
uniref:Peptidase M12A domain-containing protein n=1 Tax=Romanomermis culicivorax TaxID=13658 RepID=A0A915K5S3_ROMCU